MQQVFKTTLLLALMTALFAGVGYAVGGRGGVISALVLAGVMNFVSLFYSDKMVLRSQGAVPLDESQYPQIVQMVRELTHADALPMPKLFIMETPLPNAFATGRSHQHAAVAVTRGIMDLLTYDELKAVIGHELGHVKNRDMLVSTVAATLGGAIGFIAQMAMFGGSLFSPSDEEGNNWVGTLALVIVAPLAASLIQMAVSRSREYLADEHGARLVASASPLESALQKLEDFKAQARPLSPSPAQAAAAHLYFTNPFSARGLGGLFSTHPSTADRIARLRGLRL